MSQPSAPPGLHAPYFSRTSYTLLGAHYITAFPNQLVRFATCSLSNQSPDRHVTGRASDSHISRNSSSCLHQPRDGPARLVQGTDREAQPAGGTRIY